MFYIFRYAFPPVTKLIILHTVVDLHYILSYNNGMIGQREDSVKMLKNIIEAYWSFILYKSVP